MTLAQRVPLVGVTIIPSRLNGDRWGRLGSARALVQVKGAERASGRAAMTGEVATMPVNAASRAPDAGAARSAPPPGPKGLPLLGSLFDFGSHPLGFLSNCARDYGGVAGSRIGRQHFLALSDPDEVERVLVKEHRAFPKSRQFWRQVKALFGNGLLIRDCPYWLPAPARGARLRRSAAHRQRRSDGDVSERAMAGWLTGEPRDLHTDMMALMLRAATKTMFGSELENDVAVMEASLSAAFAEVAARVAWPFVIPDAVPLPSHVRYRRGIARMQAVVERVIQERRANVRERPALRADERARRGQLGYDRRAAARRNHQFFARRVIRPHCNGLP